jgi:hypothetical protein
MLKALLLASLILTSFGVAAEPPAAYFRSDQYLIVNGKQYHRQFFTGIYDVENGFESNPEAKEEYRLHRVWGYWGGGFLWGSLVTLATYSIIASANDSYSYDVAVFLFWMPEFIFGAFALGKSHNHMLRVINIYNGIPKDQAGNGRDLRFAGASANFAPSVGLKFDF